jgi:hypothetical protein
MTLLHQPFEHRQAAHCESGVMSALLTHHGRPLSEPMAFGLAGVLAFAYIPFIKLAGLPLVSYRMPPGAIRRGLSNRIGIRMATERFRSAEAGARRLDELLDQGQLVGLQASAFWLPYFPPEMRFHFNAHNLLIYGRENGCYLVSDPVFETVHVCGKEDMGKARFATGALAARGLLYYLTASPPEINYPRAVRGAVTTNARIMSGTPIIPLVGLRGIRYLGRRIVALEKRNTPHHLRLFLAHLIRMQEEIGTGGAGFRFLYACFLQEAGEQLQSNLLQEASARMTRAGDTWREFALQASKMSKQRQPLDTEQLNWLLHECAAQEQTAWDLLKRF